MDHMREGGSVLRIQKIEKEGRSMGAEIRRDCPTCGADISEPSSVMIEHLRSTYGHVRDMGNGKATASTDGDIDCITTARCVKCGKNIDVEEYYDAIAAADVGR